MTFAFAQRFPVVPKGRVRVVLWRPFMLEQCHNP